MTSTAPTTVRPGDGSLADRPRHRICTAVDTVGKDDPRVMRAATALAQAGMSVTVVDVERQRGATPREHVDGIAFNHVVMPSWYVSTRIKPWFLVKYALLMMRTVLRLIATPTDAYHAHDQMMLPACWLAAKLHRKPLIFDAHEIPLTAPVLSRWRRLHALAMRMFRFLIAQCTAVIVVSPPMIEEMRSRFGGPRAVLVRNIPPYRKPFASDRLRRYLGLSSDAKIALYQGAIQPNRELERLVLAAHYLAPDIVVAIMGAGQSWNAIQALIEHEGLQERVRMVTAAPYNELLDWTASADLGLIVFRPGVSANIKAALPNKLFEFMMAGVPVLSSELPAVVELLAQYETGCVVTSLEPQAIARAIGAMLDDRDGLAAIRANAYAVSARELRWDVESQRLVQLYHELFDVIPAPEQGVHNAA